MLVFLLSGCTSTRPVVKIGLIAPFEGLYRESGYEALAAMRAAIAESEIPQAAGIDVLPLALDDSGDPDRSRRAAGKILADPAVKAVVGPLFPDAAAAVGEALAQSGLFWLPGHAPAGEDGPNALVSAVADHAREQGVVRLLLAGATPGWPERSAEAWSALARMPVGFHTGGEAVQTGDGVLWLGLADGGADLLAAIASSGSSDVAVWLAPWVDKRVIARHIVPGESSRTLFTTHWTDGGYLDWAASHSPNSPAAYQIFRATQSALAEILAPQEPRPSPLPTAAWRIEIETMEGR